MPVTQALLRHCNISDVERVGNLYVRVRLFRAFRLCFDLRMVPPSSRRAESHIRVCSWESYKAALGVVLQFGHLGSVRVHDSHTDATQVAIPYSPGVSLLMRASFMNRI